MRDWGLASDQTPLNCLPAAVVQPVAAAAVLQDESYVGPVADPNNLAMPFLDEACSVLLITLFLGKRLLWTMLARSLNCKAATRQLDKVCTPYDISDTATQDPASCAAHAEHASEAPKQAGGAADRGLEALQPVLRSFQTEDCSSWVLNLP